MAHGDAVHDLPAVYLNRLSDLLFILPRCANAHNGGDVLWLLERMKLRLLSAADESES